MSVSPPLRRLSSTNSSSKESLINAYEAEEERIINVLSRKLEQLREEKIELENALEAESESHVNRLSREISALRLAQQQQPATNGNGSGTLSPLEPRLPPVPLNPLEPTTEMMLDAMRRENEQLRSRLIETERDYIRITRLNEIYREELIEHRRKLGLPVDNLIGLAPSSAVDPYAQPLHRRSSSSSSPYLSPQSPAHTHTARMPIPRPPSQIHRPSHAATTSTSTTPPSSASLSGSSPFPFSPEVKTTSMTTNFTTPGSSTSVDSFPGGPATLPRALELTYPSVPPPSLSSSFGEPLSSAMGSPMHSPITEHPAAPMPIPRGHAGRRGRDLSVSPMDSYNIASPRGPSLSPRASFHVPRRTSFERGAWMTDSGSPVGRRSRMGSGSVERGARIAETGTLVPRTRSGSTKEAPSIGTVGEESLEHVDEKLGKLEGGEPAS